MITAIVSFVIVGWSGDSQAVLMFKQQPMKMASAKPCRRQRAPAFSIFTVGTLDGSKPLFSVDIPTDSLLATHSWDGSVTGSTNRRNTCSNTVRVTTGRTS